MSVAVLDIDVGIEFDTISVYIAIDIDIYIHIELDIGIEFDTISIYIAVDIDIYIHIDIEIEFVRYPYLVFYVQELVDTVRFRYDTSIRSLRSYCCSCIKTRGCQRMEGKTRSIRCDQSKCDVSIYRNFRYDIEHDYY